jgi:hypothetical protein
VYHTRGSLALAVLALTGAAASCRSNADVSFAVVFPRDVAADVAFIEVAAFRNVACTTVKRTASAGMPEGAVSRLTFRRGEAPPAFGDLEKGFYSFAAIGRRDDCGVVALGCAEADVSDARSVTVNLDAVAEPRGVCAAGAVCALGRCIPQDTGSNCSLDFVGGGPLHPRSESPGAFMPAPALVAAPTGFVLGYSEFDRVTDPAEPRANISVQGILDNGGSQPAERAVLVKRCASKPQDDGVGLAFDGQTVLFALSRNPCTDNTSGFDTRAVKPSGQFGQVGYTELGADLPSVRFSPAKSMAKGASTDSFIYAAVVNGAASLLRTSSNGFGSPRTLVFPNPVRNAWIASSPNLVLYLAQSSEAGDAGAGGAGALSVYGFSHANLPSATATLGPAPPPIAGTVWASASALDARGWVVYGDAAGTRLRRYTLQGTQLAASDVFDVNPFTPAQAGDVATLAIPAGEGAPAKSRAFVATVESGDVVLRAYDVTGDKPTDARAIRLSTLGVVLQRKLRDGNVAVAAARDRVAVAWTTARELKNDEPPGGYAVFACAP